VDEPPKTYTGWKVGVGIVAVTFAVFAVLNLAGRATRDEGPRETPSPVVTYVTP
jgi:hypothetical protein